MAGFVEYQCSVGQGAGLRRKGCSYISCSCLPTRKIGTHCVDMGSALKNNVVQAGPVLFDVVLYLPSSVSSTRFLKCTYLTELHVVIVNTRSSLIN